MLPVIALATLYLRHRRTPADVRPAPTTTVLLWISAVVIVLMMGYALVETVKQAL
jgi:hypothetical protein